MKIYSDTQSFKGISNPISNRVKAQNGHFHVLSVQIDNIDTKDLDRYRDIKQRLNFHPKDVEGDVLTITQIEMDNGVNQLFINDKPVLLGSELRELSEHEFKTEAEKQAYKAEESAHIKLYTFIADITKRMTNLKKLLIDEDMHHVAQDTFINLSVIFNNNDRFAHNIVYESLLHPKPFQDHAYQINKFVQKSMKIFFK